ncbi:MAG: aldehyde dehydrogenase family protein [Herpetosiphon sp.]
MSTAYKNLIAGQWVDSADGATFDNVDPAMPGTIIGTFPRATKDDTQRAIAAAQDALASWKATPAPTRGAILYRASDVLERRADEIAKALTREEGKTLTEAKGEVLRARDIFRFFGGEGWRVGGAVLPGNTTAELLYTRREPLGVIALVTPWNFPIAIPAWKMAPALVYGNTVVFKPASDAPHSALLLVEALMEAGLPAGVLNFVTGSGSVVGNELATSAGVHGLSFTGSYEVGSEIYGKAIKQLTRVQLEMGGKNGLVVLNDADLALAIDLAVKGGFGLTGQACTATSRVIVEEGIADRFVEGLAHAARSIRIGNGLDKGIEMGPAVTERQLEADLAYIKIGQDEDAKLVAGGARGDGRGHFIQPTVFDHVDPKMRIAQEEIFGPVVSVLRVADFDAALETSNGIGFGLTAGVVTNNLQHAFAFANGSDAGVIKINQPTTGLALQAPFGGFKQSSANTFKEQGQAAIDFYTRTKTIYMGHG